ncbi:endonuclease/exonuclease/phosphatase family protein [Deinococcus misasensis]|uniref:endonuclease/exonuclease/phosphatase family protein n=1 Tax=Deinococcus misasensis TaxID=392413 RepID=UPI00055646B1|nr:endonuclease/exonuclease/phosphatase family protein [Deinococcus misasensis]
MRLTLWSLFYLLLTVVLWIFEEFDPSRSDVSAILTYSPHFFYLLPLVLLGYGAFRRKNWAALDVQALCWIFVLVYLMNFNIPLPQDCSGKTFRLFTYSTTSGKISPFALQDTLNVHDPEVVLLQDTGSNQRIYASMLQKVGWQVVQHQGLITASRFAVVRQFALPEALITDVRIGGRAVRVVNVQLPPVNKPLSFKEDARMHQQAMLKILSQSKDKYTLLAGNFNALPRGLWAQPLRKQFDEAIGLGLGYTFPAFLPVERKSQVWYNSGLCHTQHEVLPERGSDHRAVQVLLNVN